MLGGIARLRALESLAGAARAPRRAGRALKVGNVSDFGNFMGAVIDGGSFKTQKAAIDEANAGNGKASVLVGGGYDDSEGWFVEPTVIETTTPTSGR